MPSTVAPRKNRNLIDIKKCNDLGSGTELALVAVALRRRVEADGLQRDSYIAGVVQGDWRAAWCSGRRCCLQLAPRASRRERQTSPIRGRKKPRANPSTDA